MGDINLLSTIKGSLLEDFFPRGWDLAKIDHCCSLSPDRVMKREKWWSGNHRPTEFLCQSLVWTRYLDPLKLHADPCR